MTKINFLFGQLSYIAQDIDEGETLPIGCSITGDNPTEFIQTDWTEIQPLLDRFQRNLVGHDTPDMLAWASQYQNKVDPELFLKAHITQKVIETALWDSRSKDHQARQKWYGGNHTAPLSRSIAEKHMACTEFALVAGHVLSQNNVNAKIISGSVVWNDVAPTDEDYAGSHVFVVMEPQNPKQPLILYDPHAPIFNNQGQVARTYPIARNLFELWMARAEKQTAYMKLSETLTGNVTFYGVSKANCVFWPNRHVVSVPAPYIRRSSTVNALEPNPAT